MDYEDLIDRLNQRGQFRIKPGLDRIRKVAEALGNPQDKVPCIHIAGTNGKGSVAASLESVLRECGYRTALYTSPHLSDVRERIQILRSPISALSFQSTAEQVFEAERQTGQTLTYFEFLTAMAFVAFAEAKVNAAIIETGMGGRWDATNIVREPVLTLITSIGLDHTQWLGKTETAIAKEKAGIIKNRVPVISGVRGSVRKPIIQAAKALGARCWQIGKDFHAEEDTVQWQLGYQRMTYTGLNGLTRSVALKLLGRYQIANTALVLAGLDVLQQNGWSISPKTIEQGLANVVWPGRFEWISGSTRVRGATCEILFDGAHNPSAMKQLLEALKDSPWKDSPKTFVFAVYKDKDYRALLKQICPYAQRLILCTLPGSRALPARRLAALCKGATPQVQIINDPHEALETAVRMGGSDALVVVTGSLTLVGSLLKDTQQKENHVSREFAHV